METLVKEANLLDVDMQKLINKSNSDKKIKLVRYG
nr:MAG TPA: hypothetical protein [Caudoviricetes sp.]